MLVGLATCWCRREGNGSSSSSTEGLKDYMDFHKKIGCLMDRRTRKRNPLTGEEKEKQQRKEKRIQADRQAWQR